MDSVVLSGQLSSEAAAALNACFPDVLCGTLSDASDLHHQPAQAARLFKPVIQRIKRAAPQGFLEECTSFSAMIECMNPSHAYHLHSEVNFFVGRLRPGSSAQHVRGSLHVLSALAINQSQGPAEKIREAAMVVGKVLAACVPSMNILQAPDLVKIANMVKHLPSACKPQAPNVLAAIASACDDNVSRSKSVSHARGLLWSSFTHVNWCESPVFAAAQVSCICLHKFAQSCGAVATVTAGSNPFMPARNASWYQLAEGRFSSSSSGLLTDGMSENAVVKAIVQQRIWMDLLVASVDTAPCKGTAGIYPAIELLASIVSFPFSGKASVADIPHKLLSLPLLTTLATHALQCLARFVKCCGKQSLHFLPILQNSAMLAFKGEGVTFASQIAGIELLRAFVQTCGEAISSLSILDEVLAFAKEAITNGPAFTPAKQQHLGKSALSNNGKELDLLHNETWQSQGKASQSDTLLKSVVNLVHDCCLLAPISMSKHRSDLEPLILTRIKALLPQRGCNNGSYRHTESLFVGLIECAEALFCGPTAACSPLLNKAACAIRNTSAFGSTAVSFAASKALSRFQLVLRPVALPLVEAKVQHVQIELQGHETSADEGIEIGTKRIRTQEQQDKQLESSVVQASENIPQQLTRDESTAPQYSSQLLSSTLPKHVAVKKSDISNVGQSGNEINTAAPMLASRVAVAEISEASHSSSSFADRAPMQPVEEAHDKIMPDLQDLSTGRGGASDVQEMASSEAKEETPVAVPSQGENSEGTKPDWMPEIHVDMEEDDSEDDSSDSDT